MKREILVGDVREQLATLQDASVDCVVTSPPYWALRDYGVAGQFGLEPSWREHMAALREVFRDVHRVLKPTGNLWVNYGDTVATGAGGSRDAGSWRGKGRVPEGVRPPNAPSGSARSGDPRKHKLALHYRLRFMLNDDLGFISRSDVVWHKRNAMPLSMKDRATPKYEMFFHLVKEPKYYFDLDAIRKPVNPDPRESCGPRLARSNPDAKPMPPGQKPDSLRRPRLDNTWEARRGASVHGKGPASGQKPHSTQRRGSTGLATEPPRAWTTGEHVPGNDPSRFNVRVRDAPLGVADMKWGSLTSATPDEVARADKTGRRVKTLDADALRPAREAHLRLPPERGEDGGPDESGQYNPLGANPGDVWSIDVDDEDLEVADAIWTIPNEPLKEAHFATFPKELARRAILSSCPRALCLSCGKPRRPVYDVTLADVQGRPREDGERFAAASDAGSHKVPGAGMVGTGRTTRTLAGYTDCGCAAGFEPGVVLDPFAGSFTTCLVAAMNDLGWAGIELNPAYAAIGRRRLAPYLAPLSTFDGGAEA